MRNFIACDPGAHAGLACYVDGSCVASCQIVVSSYRGALRMHEVFASMVAQHAPTHLVVEAQYPRPGRSYASIFGLAARRGAFEHEAAMHRMKVVRVQPQEWKLPVLRSLGVRWRAAPEAKDAALVLEAQRMVGHDVGGDEACAILIGRHHAVPALYL
jgi:hypothetical protein